MGEVRTFLGLAGFLRDFVPNFSTIVAPMMDILRRKELNSRRTCRKKMPGRWDRRRPCPRSSRCSCPLKYWRHRTGANVSPHDASTMAAGAVLTQDTEGREVPLTYGGHRWSRAEANSSVNDGEVLAVIWALTHIRPYLLFKQFTLITDYSAILWLFVSQHLSSKMFRWAMKLAEFDMELK